jgi:glucose-6-phosphate dehydrogenase assembly protein OpcA
MSSDSPSTPLATSVATTSQPDVDPILGQEVAIGRIDAELRKLWAVDEARTNACLINFAVYSEEKGSLTKNSHIVSELTREHACRALLVEMDRSASEPSLRAWVTAHCHLSQGKKSVCCEQIAFALTGVSRGRLRNTVFAHLTSDLPLILWWQGELSPIFEERLYSVIDRFVFDSSAWANPSASFAIIDQAVHGSTRALVIQDLAWTRTFHYRLALASLFDDPLAQQNLGSISEIEITHHPRHRNSALQLLSWLATQANWRQGLELPLAVAHKHQNKESFPFEHKTGEPIHATITSDENAAPIAQLRITGGPMELLVDRVPSSAHVHMRLCVGVHVTESLAPADCDDCSMLIGDQLARGGKNSLFLKILPLFRKLLD